MQYFGASVGRAALNYVVQPRPGGLCDATFRMVPFIDAEYYRPDALAWFDRQMSALDGFDFTVTFCFTPEHLGTALHHTSPPREHGLFAEFCAAMVRRYVRAGTAWGPVAIREVA